MSTTNLNRKQPKEELVDTNLRRYNIQFICYAPSIAAVSEMVKAGIATPVQIMLDEEVKLESKKIGF